PSLLRPHTPDSPLSSDSASRRSIFLTFFFKSYADHPHLHSFPTRRSSDLDGPGPGARMARIVSWRRTTVHSAPAGSGRRAGPARSEEHTSELQSLTNLVCRLLLEKKKTNSMENQLRIWTDHT